MAVNRSFSAFDPLDGYVRQIKEFKVPVPDSYHRILDKVEKFVISAAWTGNTATFSATMMSGKQPAIKRRADGHH